MKILIVAIVVLLSIIILRILWEIRNEAKK